MITPWVFLARVKEDGQCRLYDNKSTVESKLYSLMNFASSLGSARYEENR